MSVWVLLAVLSAVFDAARNGLNKRASEGFPQRQINGVMFATASLVYFVVAIARKESFRDIAELPLLLVAHVVLELASNHLLTKTIRDAGVSVVTPLLGTSIVFVVTIELLRGTSLYDSSLTIGCGVVALGTFVLGRHQQEKREIPRGQWMGAGIGIAMMWAIDGLLLKEVARSRCLVGFLAVASLVVASIFLARIEIRRSSVFSPSLLSVGVAAAGSLLFMVLALERPEATTGYVVALKRSSILLNVVLGVFLLKERPSIPLALGATMILAGAVVLAIGAR
ncbi:MAG: EamA family transporter [Archangium sp.]